MTVRTSYDDVNDLYELGADVDGVFVGFASLDGSAVRARVEQAQQREAATAARTPPAGGTSATATNAADERDARIAELEARLAQAQAGTATGTTETGTGTTPPPAG